MRCPVPGRQVGSDEQKVCMIEQRARAWEGASVSEQVFPKNQVGEHGG